MIGCKTGKMGSFYPLWSGGGGGGVGDESYLNALRIPR